MPCAATALSNFSTHSTLRGNSCKCCHSWLHVQPLETQKHLVKSSQNSFHQPKNRDVHEFLPQNWLSLHQQKKLITLTPPLLPCHPLPATKSSTALKAVQHWRGEHPGHPSPWDHRLPWTPFMGRCFGNEGCFLNPYQLHRSKMFFNMFWGVGVKRCWVGFWTCSQHNFKRWWLLCLTYYSTPKQSISLWKDSHIFDLIKPLMVSHVQPEGRCVFINDVLLHSFSSLAHAFNQPLSCSVLCCQE